jgi:hypothetical protein
MALTVLSGGRLESISIRREVWERPDGIPFIVPIREVSIPPLEQPMGEEDYQEDQKESIDRVNRAFSELRKHINRLESSLSASTRAKRRWGR